MKKPENKTRETVTLDTYICSIRDRWTPGVKPSSRKFGVFINT